MIKDKLQKIADVLDKYLGDSDPYFLDAMTDDDIKEEEPIFWAHKELINIIKESKDD